MEMDDKQLAERLIGTWVTSPLGDPDMVSTATYNADGSGTEVVQLRRGEHEHHIRIDLYWSVADGVLTTRSIGSSDPARVPVGLQLKDHILFLSDDNFVSRSGAEYGIGEGEQIVKVRVG